MTSGRFHGRVVAITGAAGGIGLVSALRFASEGASVALCDINEESVTAEAAQLGPTAIGLVTDVTDADSVNASIGAVVERFGRLDVLINNAGITRDNLLFKMTEDEWDSVVTVHLRGAFLMSRAAQLHMVKQKYGRIVNISSIAALGNKGQANYSAAKAGLQGFTRTLAVELGPFGVTVNSVGPGFIATAMTDATARRVGQEPDAYRAEAASNTPVRRVGEPEDVASALAFLASEEASFITGQNIYVDGGLSL